jgi:cell division protein FtsB
MVKQVYDIYKKELLSRGNLDTIEKQYNNLKSREKMLSLEIDKLKTDEGVEAEIRSKFDVKRPGEQTVVIINENSPTQTTSTMSNTNVWQEFLDWFK